MIVVTILGKSFVFRASSLRDADHSALEALTHPCATYWIVPGTCDGED